MNEQNIVNQQDTSTERRTRLYRVDAVVLRRWDTGEADRIVTLFTREFGRRRFVARGSRRPSSRIAGHLEPFTRVRILAAKTRGLHIISQAETTDSFAGLRSNEASIATAGLLAELIDSLTAEDQQQEAIFDLLTSSFRLLEQGKSQERVALIFQWLLLSELGYRPELYSCIECGRELEPVRNGFSFEGGAICDRCLDTAFTARQVSVNVIKLMRTLDRGEIARMLNMRIKPGDLQELGQLLEDFINYVTGRDSQARRVLSDLRLEYQYDDNERGD